MAARSCEVRRRETRKSTPLWDCRVVKDESVVFDSRFVGIRILTERGGNNLCDLAEALILANISVYSSGQRLSPLQISWQGDLDDDCWAESDLAHAHCEWCEGPRSGGVWYCTVYKRDEPHRRFWHSLDADVIPKNGNAARWLCEVAAIAAERGLIAAALDDRHID